jgi:hypothetical protein
MMGGDGRDRTPRGRRATVWKGATAGADTVIAATRGDTIEGGE